jgi:hypothetical protein
MIGNHCAQYLAAVPVVSVTGGGGGAATVTDADLLEVPPAPVAVAVQLVELVTETVVDPDVENMPEKPEIATLAAFAEVQASVTIPPPAGSEVGETVNDVNTGALTGGGGVTPPFAAW